MQKIEVIVRITKDHCLPQEQTIFEWIETNRAAPDTLNYPGLEINLEHRRVFKNGQEVYMSRYEFCFPFSILAIYFTETLLFSASCSCVIFIAFRTAFICFPKAIASSFGIIITSIVLYRSCGKNGITSSFQ